MNTTVQYSKTCTHLPTDYDARTSRISPAPYCGCSTNGFSSYCEEHYPVVYQVGSGLRKRHADIRRADRVRDIISDFDIVVAELEAEGFDFTTTVDEELV